MNIEQVYSYCMSLPHAEEAFPFDRNTLVFRVAGKMFAVLPLEKPDLLIVKCDPVRAIELRERYSGINPAWHFNKTHWNQIDLSGSVAVTLICELIKHSYDVVIAKLPRKVRQQLI